MTKRRARPPRRRRCVPWESIVRSRPVQALTFVAVLSDRALAPYVRERECWAGVTIFA